MIDVYTSKKDTSFSSTPCACTAIRKLSRILGRAYDAALAATGVNATQFAVLRGISRHSGEPLSRVAEELEMDRTSLYRAITPMIRDGWIKLKPGADARSRSAIVTVKGTRLMENAAQSWEQVQRSVLGNFGKSKWDALNAELARLGECAAKSQR